MNKLYSYKGTMPEGEKVVVTDGTVTIYNNAFDQHTSYVSLTIPESVTFIGEGAFENCPKLKYISNNVLGRISGIKGIGRLTDIIVDEMPFDYLSKIKYIEMPNPMNRIKFIIEDLNKEMETVKLENSLEENLKQIEERKQELFPDAALRSTYSERSGSAFPRAESGRQYFQRFAHLLLSEVFGRLPCCQAAPLSRSD